MGPDPYERGTGTHMEAVMKLRLILTLTMALLGGGMAQSASAAVLVVAEARGIALKPGATLDSTKNLTLKQGQHVTLISETGATLKLDGPYDRPPVAAGGGAGVGLNQTLAALVTQRQARAGEFGVTRGTVLADLPEPWVLDHPQRQCLRDGNRHAGVLAPRCQSGRGAQRGAGRPQLDRQGDLDQGRGPHQHHYRRA